jgi:hypothetical protein
VIDPRGQWLVGNTGTQSRVLVTCPRLRRHWERGPLVVKVLASFMFMQRLLIRCAEALLLGSRGCIVTWWKLLKCCELCAAIRELSRIVAIIVRARESLRGSRCTAIVGMACHLVRKSEERLSSLYQIAERVKNEA